MASERQCRMRKVAPNYNQTAAEDEDEEEPFIDSGEEYVLPTKKIGQTGQVQSRKKLTRHERIERLKKISEKYDTNLPRSSSSQQTNSQMEIAQENDVKISNINHLFADNEVLSNEDGVEKGGEVLAELQLPIHQIVQEENFHVTKDPVMRIMLKIQGQIEALTDEVTLLRRQVCRVELKAAGMSSSTDGNGGSNASVIIEKDLLDFKRTLREHGLPLETCVETNDFEQKLRQDADYRNKIVRSNI